MLELPEAFKKQTKQPTGFVASALTSHLSTSKLAAQLC